MRKLCAIFVGRIDILRAVDNLAVNGRTLFAPTKKHIRVPLFYLSHHSCRATFGRPFLPQTFCVYQIPKKGRHVKSSFFISIPLKGSFSLQCADSIRPCKHHHMPCSQASRKIAVLSFAPISRLPCSPLF